MTGTSLRRCLVFFLLLAVTAAGCSGQERKRFEESLDHSIEANEISVGLPDLQRSSPKEVKEKEKQMLRTLNKVFKLQKESRSIFLETYIRIFQRITKISL